MKTLVVGVLGLQGAFEKHVLMLQSLGAQVIVVKKPEDLEICQGLVLPGGESTTMRYQIKYINLLKPLLEFVKEKPVFGTCAGIILMANEVKEHPEPCLSCLDICIERNAYGRQLDSFFVELDIHKPKTKIKAPFIRAPRIISFSNRVEVLARLGKNGDPVLVQQGKCLGATFHPELTEDRTLHAYFLEIVQNSL